MLVGWSQAFPQCDDVVSENEAMKNADMVKVKCKYNICVVDVQ